MEKEIKKNYVKCGRCGKKHNVGSKRFKKCQKITANKIERGRKDEPLSKNELCPRCKKYCINKARGMFPAISRRDNKTEICSGCGTEEALFDFKLHNAMKNIEIFEDWDLIREQERSWLDKKEVDEK